MMCINKHHSQNPLQNSNQHVLKLAQEANIREDMECVRLEFCENQPAIDLIEGPVGMINLLDEKCEHLNGFDAELKNSNEQKKNSQLANPKARNDQNGTGRNLSNSILFSGNLCILLSLLQLVNKNKVLLIACVFLSFQTVAGADSVDECIEECKKSTEAVNSAYELICWLFWILGFVLLCIIAFNLIMISDCIDTHEVEIAQAQRNLRNMPPPEDEAAQPVESVDTSLATLITPAFASLFLISATLEPSSHFHWSCGTLSLLYYGTYSMARQLDKRQKGHRNTIDSRLSTFQRYWNCPMDSCRVDMLLNLSPIPLCLFVSSIGKLYLFILTVICIILYIFALVYALTKARQVHRDRVNP